MKNNKYTWVMVLAGWLFGSSFGWAQNHPVIHWINNPGQDAVSQLNSVGHFTTSFKGSNDVTITMTNGSVNSIYLESLTASLTQTNPLYLTGFIGSAANGSGDGSVGHIKGLETALNGTVSLQFDFTLPLTAGDRILLFDCDGTEQYVVTAFSNQQVVNLTGWNATSFSGQMNQLPDTNWATWKTTGTNGTLTGGGIALTEPLFVLTPGQTVDRVVVNKIMGSGSAAIQFLNLGVPPLQIKSAVTNIVLNWPDGFGASTLYEKFPTLNGTNAWIAVTNIPILLSNFWYVTNHLTTTNTFFRLQGTN